MFAVNKDEEELIIFNSKYRRFNNHDCVIIEQAFIVVSR